MQLRDWVEEKDEWKSQPAEAERTGGYISAEAERTGGYISVEAERTDTRLTEKVTEICGSRWLLADFAWDFLCCCVLVYSFSRHIPQPCCSKALTTRDCIATSATSRCLGPANLGYISAPTFNQIFPIFTAACFYRGMGMADLP